MYGKFRKTAGSIEQTTCECRSTRSSRSRSLRLAVDRRTALRAAAPAGDTAKPARAAHADGKPDLQGTWTNATHHAARAAAETSRISCSAKKRPRAWRRRSSIARDRLNEPSDPNRTAPPQGGDGSTGAAGNVGGYNNFWLDPGERVAVVDGQRRSSLIIDPPDGHVPVAHAGGARAASRRARRR